MSTQPLRVAVVGSGPSGFYVVQSLLRADVEVQVDLFDRLPTPYGLVRYGVAPDHLKIKNVTKVYEKTAADPAVRFFGNVDVGRDVTIEELAKHYHQIAWCTGAQTDRRLSIPGEDLAGSHPATEFVAWYNGHPDYRDYEFDLGHERAIVIGVGNVAIDVARILVRTPEELKRSDMADYAVEALSKSKVKEVLLVGRRGPAQAKFTNKELQEVGEMEGADAVTLPREIELDELSREELEANPDRQTELKLNMLEAYAQPKDDPKPKRIIIRFLTSPLELIDDGQGHVGRVKMVRNELYRADDGSIRSRYTDDTEEVEAGLVFRSVGYRGVEVPGVPFRTDWGTIPHADGRVLTEPDGDVVVGHYTAGWIKRGPSGVIGTNRPDSQETADRMLEDHAAGRELQPTSPDAASIVALLEERGVKYVTFADWLKVDAEEIARGEAGGRPREKFTTRESMLELLEG